MDAFSYLSVLISIIIGLAMAQVLQGYRALLLARGRVRIDAAPMIWSLLLLVAATQAWWASFGLRDQDSWNFFSFGIVLLQMVLLYMSAAIVLPDVESDGDVDLAAHFERQRGVFFGLLLAMLATSVAKDLALSGEWPATGNLLFRAALAVIGVAAIAVRSRLAQTLLAAAAAAGFLVYIAALFAKL